MNLTLACHESSHTHLFDYILIYLTICTNFHFTDFISFSDIYSLSIFPYKNKRDHAVKYVKVTQGHHLYKVDSIRVTNAVYPG